MSRQLPAGSMLSAQGLLPGAALAFSGADVRTRVYVDGFNLYYGALKGTPFKWLDPVLLTSLLLPAEYEIERLRYFTARVSGKLDPRAPARQRVYLKALATLAEVEIHYGRFLAKTAWRPLANLPVAGRRIETPRPVTLPRGDHRVLGGRPQTLPVGVYPNRRGGGDGVPRGSGRPSPGRGDRRVPHHGREGIGRESRGASAERCVAGLVRGGGGDFQRHRSGGADPHGDGGAEAARVRRVPRPVAGRAAATAGGKPCPPHPPGDAEGGAVSGRAAGHGNSQTGGLVDREAGKPRAMFDALDDWMRVLGYCRVRQCLAWDGPGTTQLRPEDGCVCGESVVARSCSENGT